MARIEKTVFISYRRTNVPWALAVYQNLTHHGFDVFFDYTGIASGDFETVILENIRARAHFLVILTPSALERCGEPGDWLRREIETAIETNRNIVPLMLEGFDFGTPKIADQLTGKLESLKRFNALNVPADYFLEAMVRLRDRHLTVALEALRHPASMPAQQAATEQKVAAGAAPEVKEEELTAQQWFERGNNAVDLDEQVRFYTEAIRLSPDYALAFNNRANARRQKRDLDGAIEDYNASIGLRPDFAGAFYNRGMAHYEKGDLVHSIEDFNAAIRLKPHYAEAFNGRGFTRYLKGDLDGAIEDCSQSIQLKPDYPYAFDSRGCARAAKGDSDGALEDYDKAICLKSDYADAFHNRATARRAKGDEAGAQQDFAEAERLRNSQAKSAPPSE